MKQIFPQNRLVESDMHFNKMEGWGEKMAQDDQKAYQED